MTARGTHRGHPIEYDESDECWRYSDNGVPVFHTPEMAGSGQRRPCVHCGKGPGREGHDGCLGTLPGVMNACCGHGVARNAYIQFENGVTVRGFDRIEVQSPPPPRSKS